MLTAMLLLRLLIPCALYVEFGGVWCSCFSDALDT